MTATEVTESVLNTAAARPDADWFEANQRYLSANLAVLRLHLERHASRSPSEGSDDRLPAARQQLARAAKAMPAPSSLDHLTSSFGLSPFERDLLLLCAAVELDSDFARLCAAAQGNEQRPFPTFSLALAALPNPHWSALAPSAPLRRWRLVEVGPGGPLTTAPLRIDERILHHLTGVEYLDERLAAWLGTVDLRPTALESRRPLVEWVAAVWASVPLGARMPVVQLYGHDPEGARDVVRAAASQFGLSAWTVSAEILPTAPAELDSFVRLWEREEALVGAVLLVELGSLGGDASREATVARLLESCSGPVVVSCRDPRPIGRVPQLAAEVQRPTRSEQTSIWRDALAAAGAVVPSDLDSLVSEYDLSEGEIRSLCLAAVRPPSDPRLSASAAPRPSSGLWDACRSHGRLRIQDLAARIEPAATWKDLVLPPPQLELLHEIASQVRHRATVYDAWGFRKRGSRGLGISTLFAGPTGTGKTMAAEVLATELGLDLYRIDLSQVVSKYIGETEKNLRRVFDSTEDGGAIVLFDEADALFGKRSEVKDSHDRYANIEISYLLQRMEAYRGLAVLTTNMKDALDFAFLRRIRFVVEFPFPDASQRLAIWRGVFPAETPTRELDLPRLARLNLSGGNIRNIALTAAFLAAESQEPIDMAHVFRAARREYAKLGRPLAEAEWGGGA